MSPASRLFPAVAGGLIAAILVVLALLLFGAIGEDDDPPQAVTQRITTPAAATDIGAIYDRARRAVVEVRSGRGGGTGFVIDEDGTIVTNQHVVEGDDEVQVRLREDGRRIDAEVLGTDESSDLAILKVDTDSALSPLPLADSDEVRVGDTALAIGHPFGLTRSASLGIVSGTDRQIDAPDGFSVAAIQTDAGINPGNSGGPLLDEQGRVIGVNTQARSGSVGFAIPSNVVKQVAPILKRGDEVERPFLGVSTEDARVRSVVDDGPADEAGIQTGDVLRTVDGQRISDSDDVAAAIADRQPGRTVTVTLRRDGETRTVRIRLGARP